jgi:hypothetical protein
MTCLKWKQTLLAENLAYVLIPQETSEYYWFGKKANIWSSSSTSTMANKALVQQECFS